MARDGRIAADELRVPARAEGEAWTAYVRRIARENGIDPLAGEEAGGAAGVTVVETVDRRVNPTTAPPGREVRLPYKDSDPVKGSPWARAAVVEPKEGFVADDSDVDWLR